MDKGLFITFEGVEGSGKSTQLELLRNAIAATGREVIATRAPGGTPLAEELRDILKLKRGSEIILPETELLLFAACHSQALAGVVRPALERGAIVLCDRFFDSTIAYQGFARGLDIGAVMRVGDLACRGLRPDRTLLLDLSTKDGAARALARAGAEAIKSDRFDSETASFHEKVRNGFLTLAQAEPERVRVLDASLTPQTLHKAIVEILHDELGIF